jgi:photosystem II stability/assembly factor-like uncharacterized protein
MNSIFRYMQHSSLAKKCAVAILGASVASVSSNTLAYEGVLETPAMPSEKATDYLLVDIENVGSRIVAVGSRGHILYSDDRGANWIQASVPVSVLLTAVDFVSAEKGWAVGHGGVILHSNDGGVNWVKQFDGNKANDSNIDQAKAYIAQLELELDEAGGENSDLEYAIEDAEYALEDAKLDAEVGAAKPLLDVMFLDDKTGFVVGAYGFLFKTDDGGLTWANYGNRMDNQDRFHLNAIAELEGGSLLIGGEAGILFSSTDNGESWSTLDSPYDGSFFGIVSLEGEGQALAFGLRGNLFRTENAGSSWNQLNSKTESTLMSGAFDGNRKVSIAGNGGVVVLSEDGGKTFSAYSREERLGHTALTYITRQRVALVGESGVELVTPAGKNL